MNRPKVSVIIPAYNADNYIHITINSVLNQTFEDLEIIVIDDSSTDNTLIIIEQMEDSRIKIIKHRTNKGVCESRNEAIKIARGEWIAPIDADDEWHKDRLKRMIGIAKKHPNSFIGTDKSLCFSGKNNKLVPFYDSFLRLKGINQVNVFYANSLALIKYGLDLFPMFPRKTVIENDIKFREEFKGHDWLYFLLQLYKNGLNYLVIPESLYYYRLTPNSKSNTYSDMVTQVKTLEYLMKQTWIEREIKEYLKRGIKRGQYRLFTASLKEKHFKRAVKHLLLKPESLFYLLRVFPKWIKRIRIQRILNRKLI